MASVSILFWATKVVIYYYGCWRNCRPSQCLLKSSQTHYKYTLVFMYTHTVTRIVMMLCLVWSTPQWYWLSMKKLWRINCSLVWRKLTVRGLPHRECLMYRACMHAWLHMHGGESASKVTSCPVCIRVCLCVCLKVWPASLLHANNLCIVGPAGSI